MPEKTYCLETGGGRICLNSGQEDKTTGRVLKYPVWAKFNPVLVAVLPGDKNIYKGFFTTKDSEIQNLLESGEMFKDGRITLQPLPQTPSEAVSTIAGTTRPQLQKVKVK